MKKIAYLASLSALLLLSSCSKDTRTDIAAGNAPTIQATADRLTDANPKPSPMAGVVEDNPDYANGEQFYWHNGDQVKMLFFPNGDTTLAATELIYTAVVPAGTKPNTCSFTASGSIPVGDYSAYALYPAHAWSKDGAGYKVEMKNSLYQSFIILQDDRSSKHLRDFMIMKSEAASVTVTEAGSSPVNLSFKHLTSVIRFHITSNDASSVLYYQARTSFMRIEELNQNNFFYNAAHLNSLNGTKLTPTSDSWTDIIQLHTNVQLSYVKNGSNWEIDIYMTVFPTTVSTQGKRLKITSCITPENGYCQNNTFGTSSGLSFTNELRFMRNGFEAGKSYYFNLKASFN